MDTRSTASIIDVVDMDAGSTRWYIREIDGVIYRRGGSGRRVDAVVSDVTSTASIMDAMDLDGISMTSVIDVVNLDAGWTRLSRTRDRRRRLST